jgi:uncharacterized RDD family membrane protein YckC
MTSYAGFWIRLVAAILDTIIFGLPVLLIQFLLAFIGIDALPYFVDIFVIWFIVYLEGVHGGTPGKLILGLRIVDAKGKFIGMPNALLRYVASTLSALILCIGYLMIAFNSRKQGLHDKIAGTYVIWK